MIKFPETAPTFPHAISAYSKHYQAKFDSQAFVKEFERANPNVIDYVLGTTLSDKDKTDKINGMLETFGKEQLQAQTAIWLYQKCEEKFELKCVYSLADYVQILRGSLINLANEYQIQNYTQLLQNFQYQLSLVQDIPDTVTQHWQVGVLECSGLVGGTYIEDHPVQGIYNKVAHQFIKQARNSQAMKKEDRVYIDATTDLILENHYGSWAAERVMNLLEYAQSIKLNARHMSVEKVCEKIYALCQKVEEQAQREKAEEYEKKIKQLVIPSTPGGIFVTPIPGFGSITSIGGMSEDMAKLVLMLSEHKQPKE